MAKPTIDHGDAVDLFRRLLAGDSPHRLLRLTGDAKMGKSHLLRHVFVEIAGEEGVPSVLLDLREATKSVRDLLAEIERGLRDHLDCSGYQRAERDSLTPGSISIKRTVFFKSRVKVSTAGDAWDIARLLTVQLAIDLGEADRLAVVLVDAAEQASTTTQQWLSQTLLPELCRLPQLRVVVAGRTLPEPSSSYAPHCMNHRLDKVEDPQAYVVFCRDAGIPCPPAFIPEFARVLQFTPGLFVELVVPAYGRGQ